MNDAQRNHNFQYDRYQLTPAQKLLLRATLLQGQPALAAWEQWKADVDIEKLEEASYSLLPQLCQNLLAHQVEDAHTARLKGIYRRNWYANQLQAKSLKSTLSKLAEAGIDSIVFGDAAHNVYLSDRPVSNAHLLIRQDKLDLAVKILTAHNWQASTQSSDQLSIQFQNQQQHRLYVQTRLFWGFPQAEIDEQVWQDAMAAGATSTAFLLSPTAQILEVCSRTFWKAREPSLQGLADAFLLIQKNELNWRQLVNQAQQYRMILPVRNTLSLLEQILHLSIPSWVMPTLTQLPLMPEELLTYQVLAEDWQLWMRSQFLPLQQQWMHIRSRSFPGKRALKTLLAPRISAIK
ncbi:nucleotidyltransferase family protein [Leptolyngbya boryana CZ1]|uniref:Nucleotidyltransferase family protein n=1 Tax=Leptolyngbya boryana CZ1 TaxID=3060204 RepID=A0AA96WWE0_LEPBY|nr:nucleotidyltransferase family protein [Leptolyngbya boryana]WNZ46995.1 nucleotidyltransferase family protein [Leptolyngbya boryana CZ1]